METYIYTLSDKTGVRYIGKSDVPNERFRKHIKESKLLRTRKEKWISSLLLKGEEPILQILDKVPNSLWSFYESYWISQFKSWGFEIVNGTDGGEGSNGFKGKRHSDETIKLLKEKANNRDSSTFAKQKGSSNGRSKLDENIVKEIKIILKEKKISYSKIAEKFEVSKTTIIHISQGKRWGHVKIN